MNTFLYFSWKSWKIGDFSFCRSGDISFEIGFFLSFFSVSLQFGKLWDLGELMIETVHFEREDRYLGLLF